MGYIHHLLLALVFSSFACHSAPPIEADNAEGFQEGPPLGHGSGKADDFADWPAYAALPVDADLDSPFQALFAPDDPVNTLERTLIAEVQAARLADPLQYQEGANPYRIRYAVYNLRNAKIVDDLANAADAGVDVQILIHHAQLDAEKTWNTADETLVARGFELVPDHRQLNATTRITADMIGMKTSGLMHMKARIYETPDRRRLLSGSLNPGDNAVANEETLHLINEATIIDRYVDAYEALLEGNGFKNVWNSEAAVNVLFTPVGSGPRASTQILRWVEEEQEQILLMVFSLRDVRAPGVVDSLVQILAKKVAAGIPVYAITDRKQSDGVDANGQPMYWNDSTEDRLRAAGVPVYEATNSASPYTAMHHKVAVLGKSRIRVITDAANWTKAGLGSDSVRAKNVESVLFIDSEQLDNNRTGRRYLAQWLKVLKRYAGQSVVDGEESAGPVIDALMSRADWPTQDVSFSSVVSHTQWGDVVYATGGRAELGNWGTDHNGAPMMTDADNFPTWWTPSAVALPLGLSFEWKLTIADRENATHRQWESGANRRHTAAPECLASSESLLLTASWR